jgi:hypothetical protein
VMPPGRDLASFYTRVSDLGVLQQVISHSPP